VEPHLLRYSSRQNSHSAPLTDRLAQTLSQRLPGLVAIYHFGSFDAPNERPDSNINLRLQAGHPLDPVALFHLAGELATLTGRDVDLVDMIRCSTAMRSQIIVTGEVVYCRDTYLCDDFAAIAYTRYPTSTKHGTARHPRGHPSTRTHLWPMTS
jgi:hypothetical protein